MPDLLNSDLWHVRQRYTIVQCFFSPRKIYLRKNFSGMKVHNIIFFRIVSWLGNGRKGDEMWIMTCTFKPSSWSKQNGENNIKSPDRTLILLNLNLILEGCLLLFQSTCSNTTDGKSYQMLPSSALRVLLSISVLAKQYYIGWMSNAFEYFKATSKTIHTVSVFVVFKGSLLICETGICHNSVTLNLRNWVPQVYRYWFTVQNLEESSTLFVTLFTTGGGGHYDPLENSL